MEYDEREILTDEERLELLVSDAILFMAVYEVWKDIGLLRHSIDSMMRAEKLRLRVKLAEEEAEK